MTNQDTEQLSVTPEDLSPRIAHACRFAPAEADLVARKLLDAELTDPAATSLKGVLREHGLAKRWNAVLDCDRARFLGARIAELVDGPATMIDVLAGTGTLAAALREAGHEVLEVERRAHYPDRVLHDHLRDIDRIAPEALHGDVALAVASLHHEERLDRFVGWLARVSAPRFIVIENLRDGDTDAELHGRFDWFFNRVLNDFGAECPGWYWTREQWLDILSSLGEARWLSRTTDVPGIPFTYDFFEIRR